ncbi:hypothetical protein [Sulfitobacter pacificus]|uniref:hypothetical protein n=1 Tax=Sulfitobacter pacificus TaxID=1499314 RepID=UPI003101FF3F
MTGLRYLGETSQAEKFAIASLGEVISGPIDQVDEEDRAKVEPWLELQADHDAIELVLDAYSADEWQSLRARIICVAAMMMLIEREDAALSGKPSGSHPKAATRIFQLLGHVMIMPLIPAQQIAIANGYDAIDPNDLPSDEEQSAFNHEVFIPAFFDAVNLARISGASSIRDDLGDYEDFFADVQIAQSGDVSTFSDLKTVGAREWANLVLFNDTVKTLLGWDEE